METGISLESSQSRESDEPPHKVRRLSYSGDVKNDTGNRSRTDTDSKVGDKKHDGSDKTDSSPGSSQRKIPEHQESQDHQKNKRQKQEEERQKMQ